MSKTWKNNAVVSGTNKLRRKCYIFQKAIAGSCIAHGNASEAQLTRCKCQNREAMLCEISDEAK